MFATVFGVADQPLAARVHHPIEQFQRNLILPEPASFIRKNLPPVSVIRPSLTENAGAVATIKSFTADLLFEGQTPQFFRTVMALARAADAAERQVH